MDAYIQSILTTHHKNLTEGAYDLLMDSLYFDEKELMDPSVDSLDKIHEVIDDTFPDNIVMEAQQRANQVSQANYDSDTATALYNIKEAVMMVRVSDILNRALTKNPIITEADIKLVIYQEPDLKRTHQYTAKSSPHLSMASKSPLHNIISKYIQNVNITPLALQQLEALITPYYQATQTIRQEHAFHDWLDYIFSNQRLIDIKYHIQQETAPVHDTFRLQMEKDTFIDYLITDLLRLLVLQAVATHRPVIDSDHLTTVLTNYPYLFPLNSRGQLTQPSIQIPQSSKTIKSPKRTTKTTTPRLPSKKITTPILPAKNRKGPLSSQIILPPK